MGAGVQGSLLLGVTESGTWENREYVRKTGVVLLDRGGGLRTDMMRPPSSSWSRPTGCIRLAARPNRLSTFSNAQHDPSSVHPPSTWLLPVPPQKAEQAAHMLCLPT